ncbi:RmlC-like cupin domain-containing protein [Aspergillus similis]
MPNETAPAHRHTAFAMRYIIEGNGGFTAVHGRRIKMQKGDVILTPTWNYHDHGKDGNGPMIWLDGLDLPNFCHFPVHFVQHFDQPRYPAKDVDPANSPIVFPWASMKAELDNAPGSWVAKRYLKADGNEGMKIFLYLSKVTTDLLWTVSRVLGGCAERVNAATSSSPRQETVSAVYHVITGSGRSKVGDKILTWKAGDTFCVPTWYRYQHFADKWETVYLYRFDDKPMISALGFYRSIDTDMEALVSE